MFEMASSQEGGVVCASQDGKAARRAQGVLQILKENRTHPHFDRVIDPSSNRWLSLGSSVRLAIGERVHTACL
jgi:hypothetical protein